MAAGERAERGERGERGERAVCLEAWVCLRDYEGGAVLAAADGYRLEIYRRGAGGPTGALIFAGPFAGRAWISDRAVPLGRWVHVAGLAGGRARPATQLVVAADARPAVRLVIDGEDATQPGWFAGGEPLPLGHDPLDDLAASCRAHSPAAACGALAAPVDGQVGACRLSFRRRSLAELRAGRGSPWLLAPLPAPAGAADRVGTGPLAPAGEDCRSGAGLLMPAGAPSRSGTRLPAPAGAMPGGGKQPPVPRAARGVGLRAGGG